MKKLLALILAMLMLPGCQLASVEKREERSLDKLVGVFITFEPLELGYDMEAFLAEHSEILKDSDVTLDFGEGQEYAGSLPVTVGEDCWEVHGYEGLSVGRVWNGEYWTGFSSEGICGLNSHIAAGDDGDDISVEGTVYFPAGSMVMLCTNPVYQTADGEYYLVQGQSFCSTIEAGGSMSQSVSDEKTWTEDGVETAYAAEYTTIVKGVSLAERVVLVWMSGDHQMVGRTEYIPGQLPEVLTPPADAAYLIVEEVTGETVARKLCQSGEDSVCVYYQAEDPWCLPEFVEIQWAE